MATTYGYSTTIPGPEGTTIPNPESKAEFGRRMIREIIVEAVRNAEAKAASQAIVNIGLD